jgi:hypothetical protein
MNRGHIYLLDAVARIISCFKKKKICFIFDLGGIEVVNHQILELVLFCGVNIKAND